MIICSSLLPFSSFAGTDKCSLQWTRAFERYQEEPLVFQDGFLWYGRSQLLKANGKVKREFDTESMGTRVCDIRFFDQGVIFSSEHTANAEERDRHTIAFWNAFELATGKQLWGTAETFDGMVQPVLAVAGDKVFVAKGTAQEQVIALLAQSGKQVWVSQSGTVRDLAVGDKDLFVLHGASVSALSQSDGKKLWDRKLPEGRYTAMTLGPGVLYIGIEQEQGSMLWALDQATGNVKWEKQIPEEMLWPPVVAGEKVLLTAQPYSSETALSHLYAFSTQDGKELWKQDLVTDSNGHDFRPTVVGKQLVVWCGDFDYFKQYGSSGAIHLLCLDLDQGKREWVYQPKEREKYIYSRPVVEGRNIYYTDEENLFCLGLAGKNPKSGR